MIDKSIAASTQILTEDVLLCSVTPLFTISAISLVEPVFLEHTSSFVEPAGTNTATYLDSEPSSAKVMSLPSSY